MKVTKEFTFDAAHMLSGYNGDCCNLHGHTYKLQVAFTQADPADHLIEPYASMVIDFALISREVKSLLKDYDHATLLYENGDEFERELINLLKRYNLKLKVFSKPITAEHLATVLHKEISANHILNHVGVKATSLRLWETPTSYAEYESGD